VVSIIWDHVLQIWHTRNKTEHGEDIQAETTRKKERLIELAKNIKQEIDHAQINDRTEMDMNEQKLNSSSITALKTWIRNIKVLLKVNKKENKDSNQANKLPYDRGPLNSGNQQNKQNRVSRRSVQETIPTSRGV
jgi:hypothetical protein